MRTREEDSPVDQAFVDRIVDGGMTPLELRAALLRLERDPDGWKRCAVAFLEGQVVSESLRALGPAETCEPASQVVPLHPAAAATGPLDRWVRHALAAGIVAASFAIGWIAHGTRPGTPAHESLVRGSRTITIPPANELAVSAKSSPRYDAPAEDRDGRSNDRDEQAPEAPSRAIRTVARIRFGPESSRAEVPVLAGPGITKEWLTQQPPPVSEHGRVVLERQGYQVDQQRRFFTTILADGRRVAVPVDHVQIQYTGNEPL